MDWTDALRTLPPAAIAGIAVALVVVIALYVIALVDLSRRTDDEVTLGRRWVWLVIILLLNSGLGAIIYLAVGRKAKAVADTGDRAPAADRAGAAVDSLYGPPRGSDLS